MSTPDLARVRSALATIDATLQAHPEIGERTARLLATEPGENLEGLLSDTESPGDAPVKLPGELLARADALIPVVPSKRVNYGRVTRAAIVRLALEAGLAVIEAEYAPERKG